MNYSIKGNFNYHLEITQTQLNETTNITINALQSKINQIPIGCKFQWFKKSDTERIKIESQGNVYQCSIFDIGYKIEVNIQSFETGYDGLATVEFQKIQISQQLETKLSQLYHNNMKQQIYANDQNYIFTLEYLENSTNQQKIQYADQILLPCQNQLQVQFNNQIFKFKTKEDKDAFCAFFISMQSLKRVHIKFIAYNIGKINQKQVNFQALLNAQLIQLINEKSLLPSKKLEPLTATSISMATSQDFRITQQNQIQITQLRQEINQLQNDKQKMSLQIDKLIKENKELENNSKSNSTSKDQLESLDRLIQSLKNEVFSLKQRESDLMNQNARLSQALNEKKDKSLSESQFMDDLKIQKFQEMLQESNNEKQRMQDELNRLQKFGQMSRANNNSDQEREKLLQTNQKLMSEIALQTNKIKELQVELEMMKNMSRISMSMSMVEDPVLKTKVEQLEQENQYLLKKIAILEEELSKKKQQKPQKQQPDKDIQIQKLTEANKRYLDENIKLFEEIRQLREKMDFSSVLNNSMRDSKLHESVFNQQLEQQIERMQQIHNLEIQKMKKKIEKLTSELTDASQIKKQFDQLLKQNKRLVEENAHLAEQVQNLADINSSKSFTDTMLNSKIYHSDQYKEIEEQLNFQKKKNQEIQSKLDFQLQRDSQQVEKIKQLEIEVTKYKNQIRDYQYDETKSNDLKLLQNQIDEYQKSKDNLMRENIDLTQQISVQQQDKEFLNQKIKQQENQIFELKNKLLQQQEEIRTLKLFPQSAEKQFNIQLQQLQLQNKNLTEEIIRLQAQNNGMKDLSQSNISMSESILGSKIYEAKEYKVLENQKELLQNENQTLKLAIQEEKNKANEIIYLKQDQLKLIDQIRIFEDENKKLNSLLQNNNEHYSKQIMILQGEIDKLQAQLRNTSRHSSMLIDESFREKQIVVQGTQYQMNEKNSSIFNLRASNAKQEDSQHLSSQHIELIQQSSQKDSEIIRLKQQLTDISIENNRLQKEIENLKIINTEKQQKEYQTVKQLEISLQNKEYDSQQQIVQLKNQLADRAFQLKNLQQSYQQNIEEQQQVINQLGQENKNINEVHVSIKSRLEGQIQKLVEQLKERDITINRITDENLNLKKQEIKPVLVKQLQDDLTQKTQQIEQLIQTNKTLALQLNTLNFELQELRMASVSQSFSRSHIDYKETENQELQNEIALLRQKLQTVENQNEQNLQSTQMKQQQEAKLKAKIDEERLDYQREIQFLNQKLTIAQQDLDFYKNEFITAQQTLDKLRQESQQKNKEKLTQQETELISLRELKKELLSQNDELQQIISTQSNHLNELQEEIQEKIEQIKQLQKTQTSKQYEIDNLVKEKSQLSIRFQEQQNNLILQKDKEIKELKLAILEYENERKVLEEQVQSQEQHSIDFEKMRQTLEIACKKKDDSEIRQHHLEQDVLDLKNNLQKKEKQISELTQSNQYLSKELDNEQDKIEAYIKKFNDTKIVIQNKDVEIQQIQLKVKLLEDQINKKDQTLSTLNNQISQLTQLKAMQQKQIDQIPQLKSDIEKLIKEKADLQSQFELLNEQFVLMEKQIENITVEKSPIRSKNSSVCRTVDFTFNEKLTQMEIKINQQKQIIEQLEEQVKVEKQQNNNLIQLINKLNEDLREQQEKSYSLDRSSETYLINRSFNSKYHTDQDIVISNQYQSLDIYESDRKRQSNYGHYETNITELTNENKELKQESEKLKQQLQIQKQNYENLIEQFKKNNASQNETQQLNINIEKLTAENQRLSQLVSEQRYQDSGKKNQLQNQISQMEEELYRLRSLESSNQRLNNEIRVQITKSIELQQEIDSLNEQNSQLIQQLRIYEEQLNDNSSQQREKFEFQSNNHGQYIEQIQKIKEENLELQQQLEEFKKKFDQVENEMQKAQLKISVKDSQLNQNNRKNKKLEEQIQQLQEELKGKSCLITQDRDEVIAQLQYQLQEQRKECENIKEQFSKYLEFEQQITSQITQLENQIDRLTKSNSALLEENCRLNDQLKEVQNQSYFSNDSQIQ